MKKQSPRRRPVDAVPVRHQLDHVVPTVIHDPEEKMTALGRLTHHAFKIRGNTRPGPSRSSRAVLAVVVGWNLIDGREFADESEVWAKLETAKKAEDGSTMAKEYPKSPASTWATLAGGDGVLQPGPDDLPNNRDVALPTSKKALDLFDQVDREAPEGLAPGPRGGAGQGPVRSRRATSCPRPSSKYELVAKNWPGQPRPKRPKNWPRPSRSPRPPRSTRNSTPTRRPR